MSPSWLSATSSSARSHSWPRAPAATVAASGPAGAATRPSPHRVSLGDRRGLGRADRAEWPPQVFEDFDKTTGDKLWAVPDPAGGLAQRQRQATAFETARDYGALTPFFVQARRLRGYALAAALGVLRERWAKPIARDGASSRGAGVAGRTTRLLSRSGSGTPNL